MVQHHCHGNLYTSVACYNYLLALFLRKKDVNVECLLVTGQLCQGFLLASAKAQPWVGGGFPSLKSLIQPLKKYFSYICSMLGLVLWKRVINSTRKILLQDSKDSVWLLIWLLIEGKLHSCIQKSNSLCLAV